MYYQNYEDYMRAVLGYPIERQNTYSNYNNNYLQFSDDNLTNQNTEILEDSNDDFFDMYPEIYKIVNPMVCKVCDSNTEPITKELVLRMTDEVYKNLEDIDSPTIINVRATTSQDRNRVADNKVQTKASNSTQQTAAQRDTTQNNEKRETRQSRISNPILRDLIQILILRRLLERRRRHHRPPVNPGRPGNPRPLIHPREYSDFYKF